MSKERVKEIIAKMMKIRWQLRPQTEHLAELLDWLKCEQSIDPLQLTPYEYARKIEVRVWQLCKLLEELDKVINGSEE